MKELIQAALALLLDKNMLAASIPLVMYSMYLWDKRHPASAKTSDSHKPTDTLNKAKAKSLSNWPLVMVLVPLLSVFLFAVMPGSDEPLTTGDAAALLQFFMLFITGSVLFFRD